MSPDEMNHGASELRTKYAYIFSTIVEIYRLYHQNEKIDAKFETVVELTKKLSEEGVFDDYISQSLNTLYTLYPSLLPVMVSLAYQSNKDKETAYLNKLYKLLIISQSDLSQLLHDLIMEDREHYLKRFK